MDYSYIFRSAKIKIDFSKMHGLNQIYVQAETSPPARITKSSPKQKKPYDASQNVFLSDDEMEELLKNHTKERCRDAQRTYRDEQLDPIVDMFVAAFANSNKTIKDGYDSQMFESASPELLRNIAGFGNTRQCYNFTKAIKMPSSVTITSLFSSKIELLVVY